MLLDQTQLQTLIDYLGKWKTAECIICGHDDWAVSDRVFELREYGPDYSGSFAFGLAQLFPVVPLTCKQCGNVLLVSAIAAGVVPPRPKA